MVTRADIAAKLKDLAGKSADEKKAAVREMLAPEMKPAQVEKVIADLPSYLEWTAVA